MSKTVLNIVRAIIAIAIGAIMFYFWDSIRVDDDITIKVGVAVVSAIVVFVLLFFMGKGGGD